MIDVEKIDKKMRIVLMPKGLIAYALKTYLQEDEAKAKTELNEVHSKLLDFMTRNKMAIVVKDNDLHFVPIKDKKPNWIQRIFS